MDENNACVERERETNIYKQLDSSLYLENFAKLDHSSAKFSFISL